MTGLTDQELSQMYNREPESKQDAEQGAPSALSETPIQKIEASTTYRTKWLWDWSEKLARQGWSVKIVDHNDCTVMLATKDKGQ